MKRSNGSEIGGTIDRFVVVNNPASTHLRRAQQKVAELRKLAGNRPVDNLETSASGHDANTELLGSAALQLGTHTLLCIAAGDGSINALAEGLLFGEGLAPSDRRTPLLPLWGGNANDLAQMLNGSARASLRTIIKQGQVVPITPLCFRLTSKDGSKRRRIALCTASFGATAKIARQLNTSGYRDSKLHKFPGGRLIREGSLAWKAVLGAQPFSVEENKTLKQMYEYTFANGPRFAKYYHMPVKLNDSKFYLDTIEDKRFFVTATALTFSFKRRLSGKVTSRVVTFTVLEDIWAQFDGEAIEIAAGTKIEAGLYHLPLYVLSTELK